MERRPASENYEKVLKMRADRLGVSVEEAEKNTPEMPKYLTREIMDRINQVMDKDAESFDKVLEIAARFRLDTLKIKSEIKGLSRLEIAALTQAICSMVEVDILRTHRTLQMEAVKEKN
jgi:Lon protease-like protein